MSQAITNTSGAVVTGNDDGLEHVERHKRRRGENYYFWGAFDDENQGVIQLHGDQRHTIDQAFEVANKQGLPTEPEWEEKNEKKRPSRRQANYHEYLTTTTKSIVTQLVKNKKNDRLKSQSIQQLAAIQANGGFAVNGTLYYLGDVQNYIKMTEEERYEELKKYREFEREALKRFFESDLFKILHKGCLVRAEIHCDELGAIHLQTSEVYYKANSRGQVQYSKNTIIEERLRDYLGDDEFEDKFKREIYIARKQEELGRQLTTKEVSEIPQNLYQDEKVSKKQSGMYINTLFRRLENEKLEEIALEVSKEKGVEWKREYDVSNGEHLTAREYEKVMDVKMRLNQKTDETIQKLNEQYKSSVVKTMNKLHKKEEVLNKKNEIVVKERKLQLVKEKTITQKEETIQAKTTELNKREIQISNREKMIIKKEQSLDKRLKEVEQAKEEVFEDKRALNDWKKNVERETEEKYQSIYEEKFEQFKKRIMESTVVKVVKSYLDDLDLDDLIRQKKRRDQSTIAKEIISTNNMESMAVQKDMMDAITSKSTDTLLTEEEKKKKAQFS